MIPRLLQDLQSPSDDPIFSVADDGIYASFIFPASRIGEVSSYTSQGTTSTATPSSPGSVVAVTSGGATINLLFDVAAMTAPASFRAGIEQAASILGAAIFDKITVNIKIDYSGIGGGAAAGPDNGLFESYSSIKADLMNNATPGDTSFNALLSGSSIQGQSSVAVWNAQLKLWGLLAANDTSTDDGNATFATDIDPNLLVGVALHELTHALGRIPYGSQPDIFDLFRFTGAGTRLFSGSNTAPAAYFSVDGGNTKLADYGQNSDPSDFLNSGVQGSSDPFNEFYNGNTLQQLTAVDLKQLAVLGYHTSVADTQPPTLVSDNPLSIPAGATQNITSSLLSANDNVSSGTQLHFKVMTAPTHGTLLLNGSVTSSFTQADINNGLVGYHENASGVTSDSFLFTVTDAAGNATGIDSFQINISNPNQVPPKSEPAHDYNGDSTSDVLWSNDNGNVAEWQMKGGGVQTISLLQPIGTSWHFADSGDFNGDGTTDVLWRNDDGRVVEWQMKGGTPQAISSLQQVPVAWHIAGAGDFNADGTSDVLWRNDDGSVAEWLMNGGNVQTIASLGSVPSSWHVAGIGDFNGDGTSDILWHNTDGSVAEWLMKNGAVQAVVALPSVGADWQAAGTGDFNGDGKTDVLWHNNASGQVAIWQMASNGAVQTISSLGNVPTSWHIADTGDYNGDGTTDILWHNDDGSNAEWLMHNGSVQTIAALPAAGTDWHVAAHQWDLV